MNPFYLPLMEDNINRDDVNAVIAFLQQDPIPKLTNGPKVVEFEEAWSRWLGVKYSLFVNSGSSANELTMMALKYLYGDGEIIVPPVTWVSDIASVIHAGLKPVFCDINLHNLSFDIRQLKQLINDRTKAIFVTHVLGINALTPELLELCREYDIKLIEDACESHGATYNEQKVGSIGFASNFSFFFAHHMSTIEGGMICTNDRKFYEVLRCMRSHGMLRESTDDAFKKEVAQKYPELHPNFIFIAPSHNMRSTEINAVLGLNQLKRLDSNNLKRAENFNYFMSKLDPSRYITDLNLAGQCSYALIVIMRSADKLSRDALEASLTNNGIEFRRGLSGGGSQMKQPYAIDGGLWADKSMFPTIEHVHHFSWYIGNYPSLSKAQIDKVLEVLNGLSV